MQAEVNVWNIPGPSLCFCLIQICLKQLWVPFGLVLQLLLYLDREKIETYLKISIFELIILNHLHAANKVK